MSVTYLIEFHVREGRRARFLKLLTGVLDRMRAEPSFINATLHGDPADPDRFLLHETWRDHDEVVAVQLARPYRAQWHTELPELLEWPRKISIWTPLREETASMYPTPESA